MVRRKREVIPMRLSSRFLLRLMAKKLDKRSIKEVTANDLHKFGHKTNVLFLKSGNIKHPKIFTEQISLEVAQEIIDNPNKVWESR